MSNRIPNFPYGREFERKVYALYREFFDISERNRRWNLANDIPWNQCNRDLDPAYADIVETFAIVEAFLPDYVGKFLPMARGCRGRAWFTAMWGYEESKHSLALGDWLIKSGHRTEEQVEDAADMAIINEWMLPSDDVRGMGAYAMIQELATWTHYRNLRERLGRDGDLALFTLLGHVATDERAHYDFYSKIVRLHLEHDRPGTLQQLKRVMNEFKMPAVYLLQDSPIREAGVRNMNIFNETIYYEMVFLPAIAKLGVNRSEMRNRSSQKKSLVEHTGS